MARAQLGETLKILARPQQARRDVLAGLPLIAVTGPAAAAALATGGLVVEAGVRRIDRDTTIDGPVILQQGASFVIARGATLTLLGDLEAPAV